LWISDCGFRIVDFGLWISDCGFRIVDFGFRISDFKFRVYKIPKSEIHIPKSVNIFLNESVDKHLV
jgi:hypothetical protein